jgi:3-hydroxybutyrate dehydrogenase
VINGRDRAKAERTLAELDAGDRVHFIAGDVKLREDCDAIVDGTVAHFGKIDILMANAGGGDNHAPVAQLTDESMQDTMVWNFWHTFWTMRRALNHMIPQQWGRIITMSSVEGKVGKPGISTYVAAKHAINGLTKSAAREVGTLGITVNSVCPGAIETDVMMAAGPGAAESMGMTYEALLDMFAQEAATKRLCEVEDVAAVAVLLASDAGAGITGSMISIDGGTSPY